MWYAIAISVEPRLVSLFLTHHLYSGIAGVKSQTISPFHLTWVVRMPVTSSVMDGDGHQPYHRASTVRTDQTVAYTFLGSATKVFLNPIHLHNLLGDPRHMV